MLDQILTLPDKCNIVYRYFYNPKYSNPPIVFLHGLGGDLAVWQPIAKLINQVHFTNCLTIDLRGHGLSSKIFPPTPANLDIYAHDVSILLKHLKINNPIVVGHCFGGNIALLLSQKISPIITITINTTPNPDDQIPLLIEKIITMLSPFFPTQNQPQRQIINRSKFHRDFDLTRLLSDIQRTGANSYRFALQSFAGFNLPKNLSPIVAILGKNDKIIPFHKTFLCYRRLTNVSIHPLHDNHLIPLNQSPQQLVNLLLDLLARNGINHFESQFPNLLSQ